MWEAKDPTWGCLRMARLMLGQTWSNLTLPADGVNREGLGRENAECCCALMN